MKYLTLLLIILFFHFIQATYKGRKTWKEKHEVKASNIAATVVDNYPIFAVENSDAAKNQMTLANINIKGINGQENPKFVYLSLTTSPNSIAVPLNGAAAQVTKDDSGNKVEASNDNNTTSSDSDSTLKKRNMIALGDNNEMENVSFPYDIDYLPFNEVYLVPEEN